MALTFFCVFVSLFTKAGVMAGTVEGVKDEGAGGLWQGQGEKRSRIFLRWEASGFDCLERTQAGVSPPSSHSHCWGCQGLRREAKMGCVGASASGVHSHCISPSEPAGCFRETKIFSKYSRGGNGNICFLFPTVSQLAVRKAPLRCLVSILFYH